MDYSYVDPNKKHGQTWEEDFYIPDVFTKKSPRHDEVEFIVKSRISSYTGKILSVMSSLDLSCNQLIGGIPPELGELGMIHAMNLSHNFNTEEFLQA